jgi:mono/diheme cytochrome c family protein
VLGDKTRLVDIVLKGLRGTITVKGQQYNNLMPSHSFLSDEDLAQVLTYTRQNFGNKSSDITSAEVAAVRNASTVQNR